MTVQLDGSVAVVSGVVALIVIVWLQVGLRHRFSGWRWWQVACFLAGCAGAVAAVLSSLDSLGRRDLLTAHVAQHVILGDFAAPLLLCGLPPQMRWWLRERFARLSRARGRPQRLLAWALSPVGALVLWALAAYAWYAPPLHRLAVAGGPVHELDHLSFLGFGLLVWLAAFDPREEKPLGRGLREGGLPWWGRHGYAMGTRLALVPAAAVLWLAPGYHVTARPPLGYSREQDQVNAASLMIGFEMLLFAFTLVLAFIFLAIAEGKRQAVEDSLRRRPPRP